MRFAAILLAILCSVKAGGQAIPVLTVGMGQEVRLRVSPTVTVRGYLVRVTGDSVFLTLERGVATAVAREDVLGVEVRVRGGLGAGAARGAKIGAVAGLGAGLIFALIPKPCEVGGEEVSCDSAPLAGLEGLVVIGALVVTPVVGAAVGGVAGTLVPPMVWREAILPTPTAQGAAAARSPCGVPRRAPAGITATDCAEPE